MKSAKLNDQAEIPLLGLGTWKLLGADCAQAVAKALEVGYRHIDTADVYGNHLEVAKGIKASGLPREEFFLTTKKPWLDLSASAVLKDCERYLEELEVPYIDLLLIHWPSKQFPINETLKAMDLLKTQGKIKAMGVSNFTIHHLEDALATGFEVSNNQVELHPTFNQNELKDFCDSRNIVLTAYSPLGMGSELEHPVIVELVEKYNATPAQVILNWIMGKGIVAIPKSKNPMRIEDNFKATTWEMDKEDIEKINSIDQHPRLLAAAHNEFDY